QADPEELTLSDAALFVTNDPQRRLTLADLGNRSLRSPGGAISGNSGPVREREILDHGKAQTEIADSPSFAHDLAHVRADPETGQVDVLRYYNAQDVGRALN